MNSPIEYNSAADLINSLYASIDMETLNTTNKFVDSWKKIVSGIKPDGTKLASHSRIIDLKNNILLVETDHPGWTQLLQMRRKYILNGLKLKFPQLEIHTIAFKLKSDNFKIKEKNQEATYEAIDKVLDKRLEGEESSLTCKENNNESYKLPSDLKKRLDNLRDCILTNS